VLTTGMLALAQRQAWANLPAPPLPAMPVTLAWNAADDPSVSGYALYYSLANGPATNRVDAGSNTTATIFGLRANVECRIYAVSYNSAGLESLPSNELRLTPPAISRLQLVHQSDGCMRLSAKAAPGTVWNVQFTPSLRQPIWQSLTNTTADSLGNLVAVDFSASQSASRYYRVVFGVQLRVRSIPTQ